MAQRYLFFNSITGDRRLYQAQDFADYFGTILSTGLVHTETEQPGLEVSVEQGTLNTVVSPGKAIMKGHLYENTTPYTLEHRIPEPDADRIDRVVLRLDLRQSERNILLHVIEGDATNPPELQRSSQIYEISLAQVIVRANTSSIDPQDVIDERLDKDLCGLVRLKFPIDLDGYVSQDEKGQPNGVASLDENARVPIEQLPPMDYVPLTEKGVPGGVATLDNAGHVPREQLLKAPRVEMLFGNGMDGNVTISSNTTLSRDMYYNNLTINSGRTLKTNGYKIFVKGILTNNGIIDNSGGNGTNGTATSVGIGGDSFGGGKGGDAVRGSSNTDGNPGIAGVGGGNGGNGGNIGTRTEPGTAGRPATYTASDRAEFELLNTLYTTSIGGGSGGSGGSGYSNQYQGGGGGGGGGRIHIYAKEILNNGTISAKGGNGGNGYVASTLSAGGGGGGGGGFVLLVYENYTGANPIVTGGEPGTGGYMPGKGANGRTVKIKLI